MLYDLEKQLDIKFMLERSLICLTDRELFVLSLRFGLFGEDVKILKEIGRENLGVTGSRVRQIEAKALELLKLKLKSIGVKTLDD